MAVFGMQERSDFDALRARMIRTQLEPRGIHDERVLNAMGRVPREVFMPKDARRFAYCDGAQSIGLGQTISQPYIVALMTQALGLSGDERVLEVGTGSGYQAAILAELAQEVYTVERIATLSSEARAKLEDEMGYSNMHFRVGDGSEGWLEEAPFDALIVTAAAQDRPATLLRQLREGGVGVVPVGRAQQELIRYKRTGPESWTSEHLCWCVFVPLIGGGS